MYQTLGALATQLLALDLPCTSTRIASTRNSSQFASNPPLVARGKYIVEDIAVCTQCHTPHANSGELDRSRWLEGAALWLQPAAPNASASPRRLPSGNTIVNSPL